MNRTWIVATGTLGACVLMLGGASAAMAATDTAAPVLSLPASAQFVAGTRVADSTGFFGIRPQTSSISQTVSWSAADPSGICGYDVLRVFAGQPAQRVLTNSTLTSYTDLTSDYHDQQGGGSLKVVGWQVVAHDCAGNTSHATTRVLPVATQENDRTYGYKGVTIAYAGAWNAASCACWSGNRDRWSTTAGAAATVTRTWVAGDQLALETDRGPANGAFEVLVDGVHADVVDTYATTLTHRVIVWSGEMSAGVHTVTLVNLATAGHPRVDLDAVLSNSELYCNC